ncbi:MAG: sigma 54-interacting transcriptional regulator, partial [Ferruginibacter sp.]
EIQASLLRVIQERKIKRIGGNKEIDVDVRIIVATNENLQDAYKHGKFREDLYHRFNEFSIQLPPLRERRNDIPSFADFFLQKTNKELGKNIEGFEDEVMKMFTNYSWPGNLREFKNVIRRSALLTSEGKISPATLPAEITGFVFSKPLAAVIETQAVKAGAVDLKDTASKAEYEAIMQVLKEVNFNKTKAAELLNIDRKTLYNKIKSFEDAQ